jgi:hypothetical protein
MDPKVAMMLNDSHEVTVAQNLHRRDVKKPENSSEGRNISEIIKIFIKTIKHKVSRVKGVLKKNYVKIPTKHVEKSINKALVTENQRKNTKN